MVGVVGLPDPLHFQVQEGALHDRIVPATPFAAHTLEQRMGRNQVTVGLAGIQTAPVRVDQ